MNLSIIIPIYNVEKYLRRCLDSIYSQPIPESCFEVIAVNDGSPDRSMEILEEYSLLHKNIIIINKENGGVSSARNAGLAICNGKYVTFVDPDDYLVSSCLAPIIEKLEREDMDILICNSKNTEDDKLVFDWRGKCSTDVIYSGNSLFGLFSRGCVWGALYKLSFLREYKILFALNVRNAEDSIFFSRCRALAKSIVFIDVDMYYLFRREGSASRDINKTRAFSMKTAFEYIQAYRDNVSDPLEARFYEELMYGVVSSFTVLTTMCHDIKLNEVLYNIEIKKYLPIDTSYFNYKSMKINILNRSYALFYFLYHVKYFFKRPKFI